MNFLLKFKTNYFRMLKVEWLKLRKSAIWFSVFSIPLICIFLGSGSFIINKDLMRGNPWFDLWTQVALFYGYFLYPILISIIAVFLYRIEHNEKNWKILKTLPVNASAVWFSKLTMLLLFSFLTQLIMVLFYFISGFVLRLNGNLPNYFWWWLIAGPVSVMATGSLILFLATRIKSFTIPVSIELFCCFVGLAGYSKGYWWFPNTLAIIGINAQHEGLPSLLEMIEVFGGTLLWIIIFSILGILSIKNKKL